MTGAGGSGADAGNLFVEKSVEATAGMTEAGVILYTPSQLYIT